ncbi:hypothetical protein G4B88_017321 [Cannabis sativa]|uniref:Uncharacterized protein n=1 Tax=Cannabis sativa TaxID=3483 RepID=A0A7J6EFQ2_CANSA|nr:hypothetical protein G4B88_017321 [Cannabis sativa]
MKRFGHKRKTVDDHFSVPYRHMADLVSVLSSNWLSLRLAFLTCNHKILVFLRNLAGFNDELDCLKLILLLKPNAKLVWKDI